MRVLTTSELTLDEQRSVRALMDAAFGDRFTVDDWHHTLGGIHVLVEEDEAIITHAAVVARTLEVGGRPVRVGYVEAVATLPSFEGRGFGSLAMGAVAEVIGREFEMGALSTHRHAFYERLGWQRWRGPTYVRDGDRDARTIDEDDGVMVLLFGATALTDVTLRIVCEARSGDDW